MKKKFIVVKEFAGSSKLGDVIDLSLGYARNYLIPFGFVVDANDSNIKKVNEKVCKLQSILNKKLNNAKKLADKISSINLNINMKSDESGNLYGSVNNRVISKELKEQYKIFIDHEKIDDSVIKQVGEFDISIKLHTDVVSKIKVMINKV